MAVNLAPGYGSYFTAGLGAGAGVGFGVTALPGTLLMSMPPGSQWELFGTWQCP
jgi:hypothetical protein